MTIEIRDRVGPPLFGLCRLARCGVETRTEAAP